MLISATGITQATIPSMPLVYIILALVLGFCILLAFRKAKETIGTYSHSRRRKSAWAEFRKELQRKELDDHSRRLIEEMADAESLDDPMCLLTQKLRFEQAVQDLIKSRELIEADTIISELESDLLRLRTALGFDSPGETLIYSTRDIAVGTELRVSVVPENGDIRHCSAVLNRRREWILELQLDQTPTEDMNGAIAQAALYPGDKAFGFTTAIKDVDIDSNRIFLEHTLAVPSIDKRRFKRVEVDAEMNVTVRQGEDERIHRLHIHDISAGGIALKSKDDLGVSDDTLFVIDITPARLVPSNVLAFDGLEKEYRITCRIIRHRRIPDAVIYHCEFTGLNSEELHDLEKLVQLITQSRETEQ